MPFLATKATFPGKEFLLLQAPFLVLGTSSLGPRDVKALSSGGPTFVLGRTVFVPIYVAFFRSRGFQADETCLCALFFIILCVFSGE